jgi:hypothetical protein
VLLVWLDELDGRRRGPDEGEDVRRWLELLELVPDRLNR